MAGKGRAPGALFCDTNVLVRVLTRDPPQQAKAARIALQVASRRGGVILPDLVVAELLYVLAGPGQLSRGKAGDLVQDVVASPEITVVDEALLADAVGLWTFSNLDFPDAYLAALARSTRDAGVLSFDRDYDRIPGVKRVDPRELA